MSSQLWSHSPDLKRLRDEGYDVEIYEQHLVVKDVPYVNASGEIKRGTLVSTLKVAGDTVEAPDTHVAHFIGECPCHKDGSAISTIGRQNNRQELAKGLEIDFSFSSKPLSGSYKDYHEKVTTYVTILSSPAQAIDPTVTARTFPVIEVGEEASVFRYMDTASSRAGIAAATEKLSIGKVAIVGLGGTGSYVLDQVAKTPVGEIHLFDDDTFYNHNAFRSPGAPSLETLKTKPKKVRYFQALYDHMRREIIAHECFIDDSNVGELQGMDFVFLCMDRGKDKQAIINSLVTSGTPFVDVGMGVELKNGSLAGSLRVTTGTPQKHDHVQGGKYIGFADRDADNDYASNIQIADLNALNAVLAVIKWKKLCGFYHDLDLEHQCTYVLTGNIIMNRETTCAN